MRRGVSLASRLAATVLGVGFASLLVATAVGLTSGGQLGRETVEDALQALRTSATLDVAAQAESYRRVAEQLAAGSGAATAVSDLAMAFDRLPTEVPPGARDDIEALLERYREDYLLPLQERGFAVAPRDVVSDDPAALYLQSTYVIQGREPVDPLLIDDARDSSAWTAVHREIHPRYRDAVRRVGLTDLYLVDADSGRIVYSATKGPDLGTSLEVGPYRGSIVGRAAELARDTGAGVLTDLGFYNAAPGVALGAAAAPIRDGGEIVGAVVITYDAGVFTENVAGLVAATSAGEEDGDSGADAPSFSRDAYVFAADGVLRSDPTGYLDDPEDFLDASVDAGVLPEADRSLIEANGSTVLVQPAVDSTRNRALEGETTVERGLDLTGAEVATSVQAVPVDDLNWFVTTEITTASANEMIVSFRRVLVVGAAVFVVALAFAAVAWSRRMLLPVRDISERLGQAASDGVLQPVAVSQRSPREFHQLADSLTAMGTSLRSQRSSLARAREERLNVMRRMLPPSVAQRLAREEADALDEVPNATVVVVVVIGLGALVRQSHIKGNRALLDDLHGELDDIALAHGLDRIKVVGDAYFAACGHDRPYIDHAPRSLAFAAEVARAVTTAMARASVPLRTAIAINSGPVTVGMSGGTRLVYDVWGPTVTAAHDVARLLEPGDIAVTEATKARLPADTPLAESVVRSARRDEAEAVTVWLLQSSEVGATVGNGGTSR
jgi:class 3 adenylate cyclase